MMHLTPSLIDHVLLKATECYLDFVFTSLHEGNKVLLYPKAKRITLISNLARGAIVACDKNPTEDEMSSKQYRARVDAYFSNPLIFTKAYKEFEIEQAKQAGLLEPSKIVDDLLDGANLDYKQKSTLESYAVIALKKAKELGYSLSEMLDYVRDSVTGTSAYTAMVGL